MDRTVVYAGTAGIAGHACHCIGCCEVCGQCRTAPWHEATCKELAALNEQKARIVARASERPNLHPSQ